ncbi:MAG: Hint domain-containing protein [Pseudomonadota bacterium]
MSELFLGGEAQIEEFENGVMAKTQYHIDFNRVDADGAFEGELAASGVSVGKFACIGKPNGDADGDFDNAAGCRRDPGDLTLSDFGIMPEQAQTEPKESGRYEGSLIIAFDRAAHVHEVSIRDVSNRGWIKLFDDKGAAIGSLVTPSSASTEVVTLPVNVSGVMSMIVGMNDGGAIASMKYEMDRGAEQADADDAKKFAPINEGRLIGHPSKLDFANSNAELGQVSSLVGASDDGAIEKIVVCFTPGTAIATPRGEVAVEDLREGDRVVTRDNGIQEIRWTGQRLVSPAEIARSDDVRPILIRAEALGPNMPEKDMIVSPQHRVLMANERIQHYFEENEVLVAARHLVGLPGISWMGDVRTSYIHFMCDAHEVVLSNGAWTETFQPNDLTLNGVDSRPREEIIKLFPSLTTSDGLANSKAARKSLRRGEVALIAGGIAG